MSRVCFIVEGPTEESFVKGPLAEVLWPHQVFVTPIILGVPGQKGGRTKYVRVEKDILRQLKQDQRAYCTTMIDLYGLGTGFPGTPVPPHLNNVQKVEHIERAVKNDICRQIPEFRPDVRLIPYLSLHEYEGLLFSDPDAFAQSIGQPQLGRQFQRVRNDFATPEDINNDPQTAPSKRVVDIYPAYKRSSKERSRRERWEFRGCDKSARILKVGSNSWNASSRSEATRVTVDTTQSLTPSPML